MTKIIETGYGKINLALEITGRRDDGYHNIDTIFQSIALCDRIRIQESEDFSLTCSVKSLACDETNLAYKAWKILCPYRKDRQNVTICIEKRIPIAAGLAGGSTDCAAVLRGLNRLWQLNLTTEELCLIGAKLGADVPFCLCGGTMRGRGIGEKLTALPPLPAWPVLIIHPHTAVQTKKAYALFDSRETPLPFDVGRTEAAVRKRDFAALEQSLANTFEDLVIPDLPLVQQYKERLQQLGLRPLLSGSGPTLFALVPEKRQAEIRQLVQNWTEVDAYMTHLTTQEEEIDL